MNAAPILASVAREMREQGLEAVLIGNAAAALHGAPVTTMDFDFLFRRTPDNLAKLRRVAKQLGAVLCKPHGVRSYEGLRKRGVAMAVLESLAALKLETDRDLVDQIRRLQAKPMNERTHFLRKKTGHTGSSL